MPDGPPGNDEWNLLQDYVRHGSAVALAELVNRYAGLVHAAARRRVGDAHVAEDVTQAVFLILSQRAGRIAPGTSIAGWLVNTTRYAASNAMRSQQRRAQHEQSAARDRPEATTPPAAAPDIWPMLDQALDQLGRKERDAILMRYFEQKSVREMSAALRVGEKTIARRLSRGLAKLRAYFYSRRRELSEVSIAAALGSQALREAPRSVVDSVLGNLAGASGTSVALARQTIEVMLLHKAAGLLVAVIAACALIGTAVAIVRSVAGIEQTGFAQVAPQENYESRPAAPASSVGRLHLVFSTRSPMSVAEVMVQREPFRTIVLTDPKGLESATRSLSYQISNESFEVVVPPQYKAGGTFGLFVWISAGGADPPPDWVAVLARHKLIYVSANNSGNDRDAFTRAGLALDAAFNMAQRYDIDPATTYIGGFSGGGQAASDVIHGFPDVFRGAFCVGGYAFYSPHVLPNKQIEPTVIMQPFGGPIPYEQLKQQLRLAIMDGKNDPTTTAGAAQNDAECFRLDGFVGVTGLIVPGLGHAVPNAVWFEKAVLALDSPPKKPPTTRPTTLPNPSAAQIAQARRLLASAQSTMESRSAKMPWARDRARKWLHEVLEDYPTTPAAAGAQSLLENMDKLPNSTSRPSGRQP